MSYNIVKLKEVGEIRSGSTPRTNVKEYWNGHLHWIAPAELVDGHNYYVYNTVRKITDVAVKRSSLNLLPRGTVLLTSRAPIGKVAIAGEDMYCNQGFKNIICDPGKILKTAVLLRKT